jgi:hypothetical protein
VVHCGRASACCNCDAVEDAHKNAHADAAQPFSNAVSDGVGIADAVQISYVVLQRQR